MKVSELLNARLKDVHLRSGMSRFTPLATRGFDIGNLGWIDTRCRI